MNKMGQCDIQYAKNFLGKQKLVLSADRDSEKNPFIEIFADDKNQEIVAVIQGDVSIDNMYTDSKEGAKTRTDIYFNLNHLKELKQIFDKTMLELQSQNIKFDTATRSTPDPTGTEHSKGLPLGEIKKTITWINATAEAIYYEKNFKVSTPNNSKIYIDAENCTRGKRLHFGIGDMNIEASGKFGNQNCFIIKVPYNQLKRLSNAVDVALKCLG